MHFKGWDTYYKEMNSGNSFAILIWTSFGKLCMDPVAACKLLLCVPLKNFFLLKISLKYFCLGAVHKFLLLYSICVCFSVVICICELYMSWVKSSSWVLKSQLQRIHSPRFEAQVESGVKRGRFHPPKWMISFWNFQQKCRLLLLIFPKDYPPKKAHLEHRQNLQY